MNIIELLEVKIKNADYSDESIISLKKEDVRRIINTLKKQVEVKEHKGSICELFKRVLDKIEEEKQPEKPVYKAGQKVRVIANSNDHRFEIGETVELRIKHTEEEGEWYAYYLDGQNFCNVVEKDIEPID